MAVRNRLHEVHLEEFKDWLVKQGWESSEVKGDYEVLRMVRKGNLMIIYRRDTGEHLTYGNRFNRVVNKFFRER